MELRNQILQGDWITVLKTIPDNTYQSIILSPPYLGQRDYGVAGQVGFDQTIEQYLEVMVAGMNECKRVLRKDGVCWFNVGDAYANMTRTRHVEQSVGSKRGRKNGSPYGALKEDKRLALKGNSLGLKEKDLVLLPFRLALAFQAAGWWIRSDVIWSKPNGMPESVRDRLTKSHEYIFMMTKNGTKNLCWRAEDTQEWVFNKPDLKETFVNKNGKKEKRWKGRAYYFEHTLIQEPCTDGDPRPPRGSKAHADKPNQGRWANRQDPLTSRNKRSVWEIPTAQTDFGHYATFPEKLIEPMVLASSRAGDLILDPFGGACTTALVARSFKRDYTMIELNPDYNQIGKERLRLPFEQHYIQPKTEDLSTLPLFAALGDSNGNVE
jgi:DNA modification methylase